MNMVCPVHESRLEKKATGYGTRWYCMSAGCTVACWNGSTSTPADDETRRLRHECHQVFDPLWKSRERFRTRPDAYRWLQRVMNLPKSRAHIGMFDKAQCERLLSILANENQTTETES